MGGRQLAQPVRNVALKERGVQGFIFFPNTSRTLFRLWLSTGWPPESRESPL
jgi:hypothetical protein